MLKSGMETAKLKEIVFKVEDDQVDGGWVATALGIGSTTPADSVESLKEMIRDALTCHFDSTADIPPVIRCRFV